MANVIVKQERKDFVKKIFEPTIDNAIRNMRMSKLFFITEDNKFYSSIADAYIRDKEKFLPFIIKEKQKEFMERYAQIFQEVGVVDDTEIAYRLLNWEHSGYVMMLLNADTDWNLVDELLHSQGHTGGTMSCLASKILYFSPYGLDFIEHIWGVKERIKAEKEIVSVKSSSSSRRKKISRV